MGALRTAGPVIVVGVLVSAVIVLAGGLWFIRIDDPAGTDKDGARPEGAFAMAFFAFLVGLISTVASSLFARWLPLGLLAGGAVAIGIWIYVSVVALDQKPALAPMFIVLHVVFVAAFGILVTNCLYRAGIGGHRRRGIALP